MKLEYSSMFKKKPEQKIGGLDKSILKIHHMVTVFVHCLTYLHVCNKILIDLRKKILNEKMECLTFNMRI